MTAARARNFVAAPDMITEELDMSPCAVDMDGLQSRRAAVLNSRRRDDARDVVRRAAEWVRRGNAAVLGRP